MILHYRLLLFVSLLGIGSASAQVFEVDAPPLNAVQIKKVAFRGWIPERAEPLKGTLVLVPGRLGDGRGMAQDAKWQELASSVGFAILACQFSDGDPALYQYDKQWDVARAIEQGVTQLAKLSSHAELEKAPLAFWGHSAGANVSARHSIFAPARVIAVAGSKGSWGAGPEMPPGREDIPMLFVLGGKDDLGKFENSFPTIEAGQKKRAPWSVALNKNEGHDAGPGMPLVRAFLKGAIEQRFTPPKGASTGGVNVFKSQPPSLGGAGKPAAPVKLQKIDQRLGWLGDLESYEIAQAAAFKGPKTKAAWLPDEATAKAWQEFVKRP